MGAASRLVPPSCHDSLLRELRLRSVQEPRKKPANAAPAEFDIRTHIDIARPLILATFRCSVLRSVLSFLLGISLLIQRALGFWQGWLLNFTATSLGLLLIYFAERGLPGSIPILEAETKAGFYGSDRDDCGERNNFIRSAMLDFLSTYKPTWYLPSGELCTGLPYAWNQSRGKDLKYERVWLQASDGEQFASDWVFPPNGHNPEKPVVILLTGLAPAVHWTQTGGFVADAAWHLTTKLGMTAVVLVARGTMDTHVQTNLFHGARVTDLRELVLLTEKVLKEARVTDEAFIRPETPIFAAGFSMGAIILANYCGQYGKDARLRGAINFSGVYDAIQNMHFEYSAKTWQAYLAYGLKTMFFDAPVIEESRKRGVNVWKVLSSDVASVVDIDKEFVSVFNGYKDVTDYYEDLSLAHRDKWHHAAIPLLAVASRDDPITHCDALKAKEFSEGNGNLLFLITERGGHVGWPWGSRPWARAWDFSNEAIGTFIEALLALDSSEN